MITYINSDNRQKYSVLFEQASIELGLKPIVTQTLNVDGTVASTTVQAYNDKHELSTLTALGTDYTIEDGEYYILSSGKTVYPISSLNEYYQHIEELANLSMANAELGTAKTSPQLLRLPADEPFLEIDANTRAITVPTDLKQVGILGDKYAEIVFFRIDRYFDTTDLNTCNVYIEWENANGEKGFSRDFLRDVYSEKDKMIFGWIIDDNLTKHVGNVRFSVRFVKWIDKATTANAGAELEYSFSTTPATMTIANSLNYSLYQTDSDNGFVVVATDDQAATIQSYLANSDPDIAGSVAPVLADNPVFDRNLGNLDGATQKTGETQYRLNIDPVSKKMELITEAHSTDAGYITYTYGMKERITQSDDSVNDLTTDTTKVSGAKGMTTAIKFIEKSTSTPSTAVLYKKLENDTYREATTDEITNATSADVFYEKIAVTTAEKPGWYFAQVKNRVSGKKNNTKLSDTLYIPYPAQPSVTTPIAKKFVMNEIDYTLEANSEIDQTLSQYKNSSNIKIKASSETAGPATITLAPALTAADGSTNLTYQWYKNPNYDTVEDLSQHTNYVAIDGATNATYTPTDAGYYAVTCTNSFNNDTRFTDFFDAGNIRITDMPVVPTVTNWSDFENALTVGTTTNLIVSEPKDTAGHRLYDSCAYEWHIITADKADMDPIPAAAEMTAASGSLKFTDGKASIPFKSMTTGKFYLILSSTLNGVTTYTNSALYNGVDTHVIEIMLAA